eukprot:7098358-Heterocapsa_arctica.AAC.1
MRQQMLIMQEQMMEMHLTMTDMQDTQEMKNVKHTLHNLPGLHGLRQDRGCECAEALQHLAAYAEGADPVVR